MSTIIEINELNYTYLPGSKQEHLALKKINLTLDEGEFLGIFGPNGSGKSTLALHMNGLLCPTGGSIKICGLDTSDKEVRNILWKKAGMVFQYPEQQIFEATVFDEVAFGPKNMGLDQQDIKNRVDGALRKVGLNPEDTASLAPISLSGGLRRRVAIASILSLDPEILILDEPMAGLDPLGRRMILNVIADRKNTAHKTTVMISHCLKDIFDLADRIAILDEGSLVFYGDCLQLIADQVVLDRYNFELPDYLQVGYLFAAKGFTVNTQLKNLTEAGSEIIRLLQEVENEK